MPEQSFTSLAGDWIALLTGAFALAAVVWGAVMRATKPLRDRLDEIHSIAEGLAAERERVDDLNDRVAGLERQLGGIERQLRETYQLILTLIPLIDPRRLRRDHHVPPLDEVGDDEQPG